METRSLEFQGNPEALLVFPARSECRSLHDSLFELGWLVNHARTCRDAFHILSRRRVRLVVTDSYLSDGDWKGLLGEASRLLSRPSVVVAVPHDENLRCEVLRLGGFDTLYKPFDREDIDRVIREALRHCQGYSRVHAQAV